MKNTTNNIVRTFNSLGYKTGEYTYGNHSAEALDFFWGCAANLDGGTVEIWTDGNIIAQEGRKGPFQE